MDGQTPIVRVELEYADGSIQRLVGPPAEAWLEDVNNIIGAAHIRYSRSQMGVHPWEWSQRESSDGAMDRFENYDGLD